MTVGGRAFLERPCAGPPKRATGEIGPSRPTGAHGGGVKSMMDTRLNAILPNGAGGEERCVTVTLPQHPCARKPD